MGEITSQIERDIELQRGDLSRNLSELEDKAKALTDWKTHFEKNPMTMIGVAFGGGVLLASLMGSGKLKRNGHTARSSQADLGLQSNVSDDRNHQALEIWDNIKGAMIGVAATKFKGFVEEIVPGFQEQFQIVESQKK